MGINVFVWNYRGFGLSEGTPTPKVSLLVLIFIKKIKEDSEIVA